MPTTNNPNVEEIRHRIHTAYNELNQLLAGPLANIDPNRLYHSPAPGEWTIMENLAHILEFLPYWGNQISTLVAHPGQPFGRTKEDKDRIQAIADHASDTLLQIRAALPTSYQHLDNALSQLQDSDLHITGHHPTQGDRPLNWFINEFVAKHLEDHVIQLNQTLSA